MIFGIILVDLVRVSIFIYVFCFIGCANVGLEKTKILDG